MTSTPDIPSPGAAAPGLYAVPPGVDFPRALVDGLVQRYGAGPPETLAQVTVYVNTRRMARRMADLFAAGPARLLPRLRLVTDIGRDPLAGLPPAVPPLRRRLDLARLVSALLAAQPDLAPRVAAFDLANSLAALLDEMQGEGVTLDDIAALDIADLSGHWARSQAFLSLVGQYLAPDPATPTDPEARQRLMVQRVIDRWRDTPPAHPVIVAGSTGSRGATALFMQAVALLPNGAVVLPGVDRDMPGAVWQGLTGGAPQEDHPQYRFAMLCAALGTDPACLPLWDDAAMPPSPARNALVSLALRPAPVTDGWRRCGPHLGDLMAATTELALIEAPDPRYEALAIALRLRAAVEDGQTAALITPDRMLTRRVAAQLDRWRIVPDDSAGVPLSQTAAGRLVRHAAALFGQRLTAEALITLLKHPLVHASDARNQHLKWVRDLERRLRRHGPPFPDAAALEDWANRAGPPGATAPDPRPWAAWVAETCLGHDQIGLSPLEDLTDRLLHLIEALALGADGCHAALRVWQDADGEKAHAALCDLKAESAAAMAMDPPGFRALLDTQLGQEVREPVTPDPRVMIWGTLEARVQGADLVILGGLNDGTWPEKPDPDPWLNRQMRRAAGLLMPDRRIGLAAHDFQQAIAAPQVVLSRAHRDGEAETVPSRWVNRLMNLLGGLTAQNGPEALTAMRARGAHWVDLAQALDRPAHPVPPAPRPSPRPPVAHRPRKLPVTGIEQLLRDPYGVYAKRILRLAPLDPLRSTADARERGKVLHTVMQRFVPDFAALPETDRRARLLAMTNAVLAKDVPWPTARRLWFARIDRIADAFVADEALRQTRARPTAFESPGSVILTAQGFELTAKADRIDRTDDGRLIVYDYKTGTPPSDKQQKAFDKQLLLEAMIAQHGGFADLGRAEVTAAEYLGLGTTLKTVAAPLDEVPPDTLWAELAELIDAYAMRSTGYTAQVAPGTEKFDGDYIHLSRAGEWDLSDAASPQDVGPKDAGPGEGDP